MDVSLLVISLFAGFFVLVAFYVSKVLKTGANDEGQGDSAEVKDDPVANKEVASKKSKQVGKRGDLMIG